VVPLFSATFGSVALVRDDLRMRVALTHGSVLGCFKLTQSNTTNQILKRKNYKIISAIRMVRKVAYLYVSSSIKHLN
jgi:hypothetical protein